MTARGTAWCYQGGKDYYQLGYMTYQHTSAGGKGEGEGEIVTHSAVDTPSNDGWNCDQELELVQNTGGMKL
jgi:hypothetical protein